MTRGGARNRSGPQKDPNSGRSDAASFSLTALPAEGYDGPVPDFPLRKQTDREVELWAWIWTTPQACAWSMPSESWRLYLIGMYVRTLSICEGSEATAADKNSIHRFGDQIGMTKAGLTENGWAIAVDQLGAKRAEQQTAKAKPKPKSSRDRMKVVVSNGA